jgi:hypothetical protein
MLMQMPVMIAFAGKVGALVGVGFAMLLGLSLPGMLVAWLGAATRRLITGPGA